MRRVIFHSTAWGYFWAILTEDDDIVTQSRAFFDTKKEAKEDFKRVFKCWEKVINKEWDYGEHD